jgi:hypothetical protein
MDKPIIEQISNSIPKQEDVTNMATNVTEGISQSISSAQEGIKTNLDNFSNTVNVGEASSEFLDANGILAKFVFLILVLIGFFLLMKIGISILGYFLSPWSNPYLIKGSLGGSTTATIVQNPRDANSAVILRSNDRNKGIEYTWSVWLFINDGNNSQTGLRNIFVKGDPSFDSSTGTNLLNGPGLYLKTNEDNNRLTYSLVVKVDTMNSIQESEVNNIPINKWFHVIIRMQNKILDTYINGVVTERLNLLSLPKQNFNNVTIHGNGGYSGTTSSLRYFSYALNVFEINNIIMFGPDLSPSSLSADSKALSGTYSYLSPQWYSGNYNT